jgi:glucose-1-phosphate thymidylyltransferase
MRAPPKALVLTSALRSAGCFAELGVRAAPLVPIANRPLIAHVLDGLRAAGVREAAILGDGATRAELAAVVGEGGPELGIRYVDHVDPRVLDTPALVVHPADALLAAPFECVLGGVARTRYDAAVLRVGATGGEPQREPSVAACVLGDDAAAALAPSLDDGGASVDPLARALAASDRRVHVTDVAGCVACSDGPDGLLRANRLALERISADVHPESLVDSEVQGPVIVHRGALLRSTLVRGPAVIGADARLEDVFVGPYTSIGDGVVAEGAEIEHSLLLAGAEVRHPGARLTSSVVGPRARLVRDFHLPRGMRVALGADAVVALS